MKIIAFIPSRYNSTRFPGKPLAFINGEPMIRHVYRCAASCPVISKVYVATDDERIFQCVRDFGGEVVITRKEHPSGTDRIAEAIQNMRLGDDDLVVNIQGDQPFFEPDLISSMVTPFTEDSNIVMSTLKYKINNREKIKSSNIVKVVTDNNGFALYFSRYPIPFHRDEESLWKHYKHLGFYAYRKDFLLEFCRLPVGRLETAEKLEQLRALEHGYRIRVVEVTSDSIDVDTPEDIKKVEEIINRSSND